MWADQYKQWYENLLNPIQNWDIISIHDDSILWIFWVFPPPQTTSPSNDEQSLYDLLPS